MTPPSYPSRDGRPLVLGHRGASAEAPENTLAAFRRAVDQGADGFELDVWRCASGEAVVIHDEDAIRTGRSPLRVTRTRLEPLRELDVGSWRGEAFRGERIPTLGEVLDAFPSAVVNVELKAGAIPDLRLAVEVARILRQRQAGPRAIVSSFSLALLAAFRSVAPEFASGFLVEPGPLWRARLAAGIRALRPTAVHASRLLVTPGRFQAWRAAGLRVLCWTVDDPDEVERLVALGIDAVVSNAPGAAREAVRRAAARRSG